MADIKLKIEVNPNAETETLGDISTINEISNTSFKVDEKGVYLGILKDKINGANKLSLAQPLVFDSNGYLINKGDSVAGVVGDEQNPDQFVWGAVPDNKELHIKLIFTKAQSLKDIVIYGDNVSNQFPTRAIIDGNIVIESDDTRWAIDMQTESDTHTIEFTHWNRANYNACLTGISVMLKYYEINKFNGLKLAESLAQSNGQPNEIFYGSVANSGSVEVIDVDGEIAELIDNDIIKSNNMNLEIVCSENQIQHHIINNNRYSTNSRIFSSELTNEINNFDKITLESRNTNNYEDGGRAFYNLEDVIYFCLSKVGYSDEQIKNSLNYKIIIRDEYYKNKTTVGNYLRLIRSETIYTDTTSVSELINKVCSIAQLNLIETDNGELKFISARPIRLSGDEIIIIPKSMQYSPIDVPLVVNNKYNNVKYTKRELIPKVEKIIDITFYYDEDGNIKLDSADVDSPTLIVNSYPYANQVTFFKTITNNGEFAKYGDYEVGQDSIVITNNYDNNSTTVSPSLEISTKTKENYKFEYSSARLSKYSTAKSELFAFKISIPRASELPKSTVISVFGKIYYINEVESQYNDSKDNIYTLDSNNKLLNSNLYYGKTLSENISMYDIISQNIIDDYKNGIKNMNITIACGNYNSETREYAINWTNNQEVIQLDTIIRIDNDNNGTPLRYKDGRPMYWRVIGREFRYSGVPMIDLQLQEVVTIE